MISCEKATTICNKTQYGESSFIEKIKLRYHLLVCKTCRALTKKNTEFTSICDKANLQTLSEKQKEEMKKALQQKI